MKNENASRWTAKTKTPLTYSNKSTELILERECPANSSSKSTVVGQSDNQGRNRKTCPRPLRYRGEATTRMTGRQTIRGEFRLGSSPETKEIFKYCLGLSAIRNNIAIHFFSIEGNEYRVVGTDEGNASDLSNFHREFHSDLTRAMNKIEQCKKLGKDPNKQDFDHFKKDCQQWDKGSIWDNQRPIEEEIHTIEDFKEAIVKRTTKPVREGYVKHPSQWPGFTLTTDQLGNSVEKITKPKVFRDSPNDKKPEEIELKITLPLCVEEWIKEQKDQFKLNKVQALKKLRTEIDNEIELRTTEAVSARTEAGRGFLDPEILQHMDSFTRPKDLENEHNAKAEKRRKREQKKNTKLRTKKSRRNRKKLHSNSGSLKNKTVKAKHASLILGAIKLESDEKEEARRQSCPLRKAYEQRYQQFVKDYYEAYKNWIEQKPAIFPLGTYLMHKVFKVQCKMTCVSSSFIKHRMNE